MIFSIDFYKNITVVLLLITLYACENHVVEDSITVASVVSDSCDPNLSFSKMVQPIIEQRCTRCHGGSQAPDLRTYNDIRTNASRIQSAVVSRRMPLGGSLTNAQITIIDCWITNGALDN